MPSSRRTPVLFSSSSDTDDDATAVAVDALIAEAKDLCALEQIVALNTAHLSDSSLLPTDLETRFRKLKSFPATNPAPRSVHPEKENIPKSLNRSQTTPQITAVEAKKYEEPISSPDDGQKAENPLTPVNEEAVKNLESEAKSDIGSPPLISTDSSRDLPSPPKQRCCFGCLPKKVKNRKAKEDDILAELGVFSLNEEKRKLQKALQEQEKMSREAAKMVRWAKQASARMNTTVDELWSDDEELK